MSKKIVFAIIVVVVIIGTFFSSVQKNYGVDSFSAKYNDLPGYKNNAFNKANFPHKISAMGGKLPASVEINKSAGQGNYVARIRFVNEKGNSVYQVFSQEDAKAQYRAIAVTFNNMQQSSPTEVYKVQFDKNTTYSYFGLSQSGLNVIEVCKIAYGSEDCAILDERNVYLYTDYLRNFMAGKV